MLLLASPFSELGRVGNAHQAHCRNQPFVLLTQSGMVIASFRLYPSNLVQLKMTVSQDELLALLIFSKQRFLGYVACQNAIYLKISASVKLVQH